MKNLFYVCLVFLILSCNSDMPDKNVNLNLEKSNDFEVAPVLDIKIEFLKIPKKGSSSCKFGFGICVTIILFEDGSDESVHPIRYDANDGTVDFLVKKIDNNHVEIVFPSEIVKSPEHKRSDFDHLEIGDDTDYGDVILLEGKYQSKTDSDGNLTYKVDADFN